jgi:hypothetical protein
MLDDFQQSLDRFGVPQPEQEELKAIVDSTKESIVLRPFSGRRSAGWRSEKGRI